MQITQYTARKRIGFKLPREAFEALVLVEDLRSPLFHDVTTLRLNLSRIESVAGSHMGLAETASVFVDIDTDHAEETPSLDMVADTIEAHARAALAVRRFLPGALESGYVCFPQYSVDGSLVSQFGMVPAGRVVHVDDEFAVIADTLQGSASIHYIRNGMPAWTEAPATEAVSDVFAAVLGDATEDRSTPPVLPTSGLDQVTQWAMSHAYIPELEHDGTFDVSEHRLRDMVAHAKVLYADSDVILTGSSTGMTAHFDDDGRYGCALFHGDNATRLYRALQTPGLAVIDPQNPARAAIDESIAARRHYLATRDLPASERVARGL